MRADKKTAVQGKRGNNSFYTLPLFSKLNLFAKYMIEQLSRNAILLQIEVYFINHDAASFIALCPDCQIVTVLFIPLCLIISLCQTYFL